MISTGTAPGNRGDVLILHGLGDHIDRFRWAIQLLDSAGYRVVGIDWPGCGKSPGVRGDLPTMEEAGPLVEKVLNSLSCSPIGVLAHSTGAFYLARFLADGLPFTQNLKWVWFSSPLIAPAHGQPPFKIAIAKLLSRLLPKMTLSTGVNPSDCHDAEEESGFPEGVHNRISLRFGAELMAADEKVDSIASRIPADLELLFTQGSSDSVCPPKFAVQFFNALKTPLKTMILVSGGRHEPFQDRDSARFTNALRSWLRLR